MVYCWGASASGQLGDGDSSGPDTCVGFGVAPDNTPEPCSTQPVSTGITASTIATTGSGYCAILTSGQVDCWGANGYGQVGDGTSSGPDTCYTFGKTPVPVACSTTPVPIGISATSLAHSDSNTCAILPSGAVDCWGYNPLGQLGDGTSTGPDTCAGGLPCGTAPGSVGITATSIVGGGAGYCAILTSGAVDCWGSNNYGQLGDGALSGPDDCYLPGSQTATGVVIPPTLTYCSTTPVATGISATSLASDGSGYCAVLTSSAVDCWGLNDIGELGAGTSSGPDTCYIQASPTPIPISCSTTPVATGISATSITSDGAGYCAVLTSGAVDCWGENNYGQIGDGTSSGPDSCNGIPCSTAPDSTGVSATSIGTGGYGYCAILTSGAVDCWGNNQVGQLGNGSNGGPETCAFELACSTTPLATGISATSLAGSSGQDPGYCAVLTGGIVDCWGGNSVGELGNGTSFNYTL
jgi:alpha-tubulin suppressor-like RCC1 family protein